MKTFRRWIALLFARLDPRFWSLFYPDICVVAFTGVPHVLSVDPLITEGADRVIYNYGFFHRTKELGRTSR